MMYRIEPLYYKSPDYAKVDGDHYINLKYVINVVINERMARVFTLGDIHNGFTISKIQAMEILRLMENLR